MADKYAKQGAKLWAIPERWSLFVSGCKRIVRDCVLWHGRAQAAFGSLEQPDSDGIAGTADIEFEDEFSQALQEACQEAGVSPFERGPRAMGAMGSAPPPPPPPPHPAPRDFLQVSGVPWVLRGHSIVQATVQAEDGAALDDIIFCKCCGASAHQSARGGLQSYCKGSSHSGYKTQRSRLRRGLFPGHNLGKATVGTPFGPTDETKAVWGPLLGFEPVGGGAGWDAGPNSEAVEAPVVAEGDPLPTSAIAELPALSPQLIANLHGFATPEALVAWESDQRRRDDVSTDWDEEDSIG